MHLWEIAVFVLGRIILTHPVVSFLVFVTFLAFLIILVFLPAYSQAALFLYQIKIPYLEGLFAQIHTCTKKCIARAYIFGV